MEGGLAGSLPSGTMAELTLDSPQLARARELFRRVINEHGESLSTSSLIADRLEQLICNGSRANRPLTESMLAHEFGVGRRIARQTSRILKQRGILSPRRGGNGLGGLWVITPNIDETVVAVVQELEMPDHDDVLGEAGRFLGPLLTGRHDALAEMVRALLDSKAALQRARTPRCRSENLAEWVAERLLDELALSQTHGEVLAPLSEIACDYGVSLEVAVEAVRILADARKVEVRRGRAGGVFACSSGNGRALHVANAYFATNGVSTDHCREVLDRINTGMIELARHRRTSEGLDRIRHSFQQMQQATNGTDLGRTWYGFIREIADMAANPVMHFMARALASSILMRRTRSAELPDAAARELLAASAQIMDHLGDTRQAPVVAAQSRCQKALENYW